MDYLILWRFTQKPSTSFKTQVALIKSSLIGLVKDKGFQNKKTNFYITKVNKTDVRLAVFTKEEKSLDVLKDKVNSYTKTLIKLGGDEWDGRAVKVEKARAGSTIYYESDTMELDFRKYLENITLIGLDLHQLDDFNIARNFAVEIMYKIPPLGVLETKRAQTLMEEHFQKHSKYYRSLKNDVEKANVFWKNFSYHYFRKPIATPWRHFYYNIILGLEPRIVLKSEETQEEAQWELSKKQFLDLIQFNS